MALTLEQNGGPMATAEVLAPELARYRALIRQDRRQRYLGAAAIAVGVLWLALSLLALFDLASPLMSIAALVLTVALLAGALLYERWRQPTLGQTAVVLDRLLDERERMVTSVELMGTGVDKPMEAAQIASSAGMLEGVDPRSLYPARMPWSQFIVAGGLLLLALGIFIFKGIGDDNALIAGNLPPSKDATQAVVSPTAQPDLPGSGVQPPNQSPQAPQPSGQPSADSTGVPRTLDPGAAQKEAADSRDAQKSLQRLAQALDQQSVTQGAADAIRKGDYDTAGTDLTDLGKNNDQLSDDAKKSMADALNSAAQELVGHARPAKRRAERRGRSPAGRLWHHIGCS